MDADHIKKLIDQSVEDDAEDGRRGHLGGSLIGNPCKRHLWYSFRWAANKSFSGRMYRLFNRGHLEEYRFVAYLRRIGMEVREYSDRLCFDTDAEQYLILPWEADFASSGLIDCTGDLEYHKRARAQGVEPKQWRILDVMGHFGGSLDGMATNVPGLDPSEEILLEFKTHNTKSFCKLVAEKVASAKPVHWAQMQVYMYKTGLKRALYVAVNKNDDDLHTEFVEADYSVGAKLIQIADQVINSPHPPARLWNNATGYDCKFCDHAGICHMGEKMLRGCRTCKMSRPVENGAWFCDHWNSEIPLDAQKEGCDCYKQITD